jgi:hypothetical protein
MRPEISPCRVQRHAQRYAFDALSCNTMTKAFPDQVAVLFLPRRNEQRHTITIILFASSPIEQSSDSHLEYYALHHMRHAVSRKKYAD